jgi:hypothetical protein
VASFKWCASIHGRTFYAMRSCRTDNGSSKSEYMHRLILSRKLGRTLSKSEHVDHINGDGLDNQRKNLRPSTRAQNYRNCRRRVGNLSSRYLGVSWDKSREKWMAAIWVNGKRIHIARHPNEVEAAQAREAYVKAHPELHARTNFPQPEGTL